jgi:DNA-binding CsgD family transcriptional regulator
LLAFHRIKLSGISKDFFERVEFLLISGLNIFCEKMGVEVERDIEREKLILKSLEEVRSFAESIPGVVIIHELPDFTLRYMSPLGLRLLGKDWEEVDGISGEEYHRRFFNPDFATYSVPLLLNLIQENKDDVVSYFQQVRTSPDRQWDWYMSMTRIHTRDRNNMPLLCITVAMKIDPNNYFTAKAARLLEENEFLRKNHDRYSRLTNRERQILKLMVLGKSASGIAAELHITTATAETHRKKVKQKLEAKNSYELGQFARAFDLL